MRLRISLLLICFVTGCGPAWTVIRASSPSSLQGQTDIAVVFEDQELSVEGLPLKRWMEKKTAEDAKYPETWADLMAQYQRAVLSGVQFQFPDAHLHETRAAPLVLVVRSRTFTLGRWNPFAPAPTSMDVAFEFRVNGEVTDSIAVKRRSQATVTKPSVFDQLPVVGDELGRAAGSYLDSKQ